ncbi:hypothetical protein [Serratia sp. 1D1416]|uniref:hypothetical protein n=1 Tax=Serratia sp. 1D1416 TaxID=2447890 RepID=UPI001013CB5A|nr:hypothetical protein [Serratia sp. 1D1416]
MTTIIRDLDTDLSDSGLPPLYEPFASVAGLIAGWRFGEGFTDLSGNRHVIKEIGTPSVGEFYIRGDKNNGFITDVPDGQQRTLIAVHRHSADVNSFGYPVSSITQQTSTTGVGLAISDVSSASVHRRSLNVGGQAYNQPLYGVAGGPSEAVQSRNKFAFTAITVDGAGNTAGLYVPSASQNLIPATIAEGVNLANRIITEPGGVSYYRLIAWRSPTIPSTGVESGLDLAEVLFYDRALSLEELQIQYGRSQRYFKNSFGELI